MVKMIAIEKKIIKTGNVSRAVIIPKEWAKDKKEVGIIVFDLNDETDRTEYFNARSQIWNLK